MQLFKGLSEIIKKIVPSFGLSEREAQLLSRLDPDKLYVENVQSILRVSHGNAVRICETAVRQGLFLRGIEVRCPDGAVAATADTEDQLPSEVRCWRQAEGHFEPEMLPTTTLEKTTFYRLNDFEHSAFGQTA